MTVSCVVLDRDGTLIRYSPYLFEPAKVEVLPGVIAGVTELLDAGCKLFLHTNQSGVGRGYFSIADAAACNDEMLRQIGLGKELFQDVKMCPETPGDGDTYRKPSPRYGLEVMNRYGIAKSKICYLGDNVTDLVTAKNIGCLGVGLSTGLPELRENMAQQGLPKHFPVFDSFLDASKYIVGYFRQA